MKVLIFDSGTLINLSMNGLLYLLDRLKKEFNGKFIITKSVKYEIMDRPIKVPRFKLGALRLQKLLKTKVVELPEAVGISEDEIKKETKELMNRANHLIKIKNKWIEIVSDAEVSCLAVSSILTKKGVDNLIAIDERTTRILSENPRNLEKIISRKMHQKVDLTGSDFKVFKQYKFIRSSELVYVAYKKDLIKIKDPATLEAVLYATKFKGSSISWDEIRALKKL